MAIHSLGVITSALVLSPAKSAVPAFLFFCNLISVNLSVPLSSSLILWTLNAFCIYSTADWCRSRNLPHLNPYQSSSIKILPQGMFMHTLKQPVGAEPRPACWGRTQEEGVYCSVSSQPHLPPPQSSPLLTPAEGPLLLRHSALTTDCLNECTKIGALPVSMTGYA